MNLLAIYTTATHTQTQFHFEKIITADRKFLAQDVLVPAIRDEVSWRTPPQLRTASPVTMVKMGLQPLLPFTLFWPVTLRDQGKNPGKVSRCYQRPPFHKLTFKFHSENRLGIGQHGARETMNQKWIDIGLHPQPGHIAGRDTTDIPVIANSAVTIMSVGGLDTVVSWSMLNKQFFRGKKP